jgi:hypothetical protein
LICIGEVSPAQMLKVDTRMKPFGFTLAGRRFTRRRLRLRDHRQLRLSRAASC